ncbi:MAG: DMP19 family protein [Bacteroidales bacterium]|jgi:hypothetical protein|nr:DMP19 family protein [Bacteroidales bacterium]
MNSSEIIEEKYAEAVIGIREEWFNTVNTKWYDYVIGLPIHLQITYLVIVFHNQIFNGGFHQYFVNGYGQFARETINALKTIGALKKAELLKDAWKIVNIDNSSDEVFRKQLLNKEITQLFFQDGLFDSLDKLDSIYFADVSEDIEQLLGNYLQGH